MGTPYHDRMHVVSGIVLVSLRGAMTVDRQRWMRAAPWEEWLGHPLPRATTSDKSATSKNMIELRRNIGAVGVAMSLAAAEGEQIAGGAVVVVVEEEENAGLVGEEEEGDREEGEVDWTEEVAVSVAVEVAAVEGGEVVAVVVADELSVHWDCAGRRFLFCCCAFCSTETERLVFCVCLLQVCHSVL